MSESEAESESLINNDIIIVTVTEDGKTTEYLCLDSDKFTKITGLSLNYTRITSDKFKKVSDDSEVENSGHSGLGSLEGNAGDITNVTCDAKLSCV